MLSIFICFIAFLAKLSLSENVPYSSISSLVGHINLVLPVPNLISDHVLVSSSNSNIGLLNYKTGILKNVLNYKKNEDIKKVHTNDKYTFVLVTNRNLQGSEKSNCPNGEDTYSYINVYTGEELYLLNILEYKNETIIDFIVIDEKIYVLLNDRISIRNLNDNSIDSIVFKEHNINSIYSKIIKKGYNNLSLLYVDSDLFCHLVLFDTINNKIIHNKKITNFQINNKLNNYVSVINNKNTVVIYNKKDMHIIELSDQENNNNRDNIYNYYYQKLNGENKDEENKDGGIEGEVQDKSNFIMDNEMENLNADEYFVIKLGNDEYISMYKTGKNTKTNDNNIIKLIKQKKSENELVGYYIDKDNKKKLIYSEDKEGKIFVKSLNEQNVINKNKTEGKDDNNNTIAILNKGSNVYYHGELLIGVYDEEDKSNYFFSVYQDSSFSVYKNNDVHYTREEALSYVKQMHFYNFDHLKNTKNKSVNNLNMPEFSILKELEKYLKRKISSLNKSYIEEIMNNTTQLSLVPFNFFYLTVNEKLEMLNILINKNEPNDIKRKTLIDTKASEKNGLKTDGKKDSSDNSNSINTANKDYKYEMMKNLIKNAIGKYETDQSSNYAKKSIVLVSTSNNFIFAIHLYTGLILYKIDMNPIKGANSIISLKNKQCSYSLNKNNWSEYEQGEKIIFLNTASKGDISTTTFNRIDGSIDQSNGLSLFKSFSKDSALVILKTDSISHIIIFDILTTDIIFERKLNSFAIQNLFIYTNENNKSIIAVDKMLRAKMIPIENDVVKKDKTSQNEAITEVDLKNEEFYFYTVNSEKKAIQGYRIIGPDNKNKNTTNNDIDLRLIETYFINMNTEQIEVYAKSLTKQKDIFYPIKINKDASICYKYINNNIIAYVTKTENNSISSIAYTIYIIDGVTGTLIHSKTLDKHARPPFHIIINENIVVLHFYNANINKYVIKAFELLLDKKDPGFINLISSKKDKFVDLFDVKNVVVKEQNYIIDHNVKSFNFTETKRGITNKHLLLLLDTNKIAMLNLTGENKEPIYKNLNTFITHKNILYNSKGFVSNESMLESTTLIFSWGDYFYFTSYQPNGSFDTMDSFNIFFLLFLIFSVFIASYFSYITRKNKIICAKWA
ncbi:ER membrane protein complex subunit 1, putative [Plasmodium chabaudi chabaudi]|uniref:ER membrane protein complex subunit 1 n=1 Tax=Plasmodium chabaudi chabaudi TaxID=31271 RepID=A0A4V0KET6_PLACU|nr:ER membrane protein complex subunit 1, putative [Plasmodium chabaudi chabaudi]VTZ70959.1 ER membrane protein complex subunit 1, putative [Plasmodium chabaudi chabaudi]|eukprot:XP_016654918.1 conserved Plasmodium protein, unknown function [Plasmodium chabaudi chabaudi]